MEKQPLAKMIPGIVMLIISKQWRSMDVLTSQTPANLLCNYSQILCYRPTTQNLEWKPYKGFETTNLFAKDFGKYIKELDAQLKRMNQEGLLKLNISDI